MKAHGGTSHSTGLLSTAKDQPSFAMGKETRVTPPPAVAMFPSVGPTLTTRYNFTGQFLRGGRILAKRALEIEEGSSWPLTDELHVEHRANVVGAIVQAAMALEAQIAVVVLHGPAAHLSSAGIDRAIRDRVTAAGDELERGETLEKYNRVLTLLGKPEFDRGRRPYQSADLLVRARNELVHYKARWNNDARLLKWNRGLRAVRIRTLPGRSVTEDPHNWWLVSSFAVWAIDSAEALILEFFERLGIAPPIKGP